ncbi:serine/threonine-protein kinase [Streptacidiphilus sp. MAP5-3]|uniref:serine/threonine-protein kinase n=1 Tax=unclassified Streptacidiphilus TaxID=2643834 RepID=UPI003512C687
MGQVWQAHDGTLGRSVAVKVITLLSGGGSRGNEARTRFLREAQITGLLQHPNIVTVHDLGEVHGEDGTAPFLVMELLRGEGLDAVLRRGPVPLPQAADWGAQICEALAEAHRADVLHRDIKPSNIQVMPSGAVKVLDFGIARAADPYATADRITQTGFIVGTPPYMAPEQARGKAEKRSDLYALGCLLFEMITGRLPFEAGDTLGYITAHLTEEPPAPSTLSEGIPPAWDDVVLTLLRKEPGERYDSAVAVAGVLRGLARAPWHPPTVVDRPRVDRPGVDRPGVDRPAVEHPGVERPGATAELAAARRAQYRQLATALRRLERRRSQERPQVPPEAHPEVPAEVLEGVVVQKRDQVIGPLHERARREPGWFLTSNPHAAQPAAFPRPLGPHVYGLLVKVLIAAAVLTV